MTVKFYNKRIVLWMILMITPLVSFCLDEYAPSLPHMAAYFQVNSGSVQLSMTIYILALGVSQWAFGFLSDRYGRRPIFNIGMCIAILGTVICALSPHLNLLLVGRLIQGLGLGSAATTFAALTGDAFEGDELNQVASYTTLIYGFVPIVAPLFGGYIQAFFGWRANFMLMLMLLVIITVIVFIKLPETHQPSYEHRLVPKRLLKDYVRILSNLKYVSAVCVLIFSWSLIIAFSCIAPFIFQKEMHYTAIQYAHLALLVGIAFLLGNLSVSYLLKKINIQNIILYSASVILICNTGLFLFSLSYPLSSWEIISLTFMSIFCVGLLFPCAYGLALGVFTNLAGIAGSIIGSLMCFGAVIVTVLISYLNISTAIGYTTLYFIIAILCFIFSLLVFRESV